MSAYIAIDRLMAGHDHIKSFQAREKARMHGRTHWPAKNKGQRDTKAADIQGPQLWDDSPFDKEEWTVDSDTWSKALSMSIFGLFEPLCKGDHQLENVYCGVQAPDSVKLHVSKPVRANRKLA